MTYSPSKVLREWLLRGVEETRQRPEGFSSKSRDTSLDYLQVTKGYKGFSPPRNRPSGCLFGGASTKALELNALL